jgi:hypothetical protein
MKNDGKDHDFVKQDLNLLEYPMWMQQPKKETSEVVKWVDRDGYVFKAAGGVPGKVDMLILYYLMLESQNRNWDDRMVLSRYQILTGCGMGVSKPMMDRLKQSLEKWKNVVLAFSGTWYSGKAYHDMQFGIVDYWGIREKDNKLEIRLNLEWIEKVRASDFFRHISFAQMKTLRSPLALRLYEILIKTFHHRDQWEIDVLKLAAKIPMQEKYFSDIAPKIEAAARRVSDKTELAVKVKTVKQGRGKGKFIFTRLPKQKPVQGDLFTAAPPPELPDDVMGKLPAGDRVSCQEICQDIITRDGVDGLRFYIDKAVGRKQSGRSNTSGYLKTVFDLDLYGDVKAAKKAATDQARADLQKQQKQAAADHQEQDRAKAGRAALAKLKEHDPERYQALRQKIAGDLGIDLDRMKRGESLTVDLGVIEMIM